MSANQTILAEIDTFLRESEETGYADSGEMLVLIGTTRARIQAIENQHEARRKEAHTLMWDLAQWNRGEIHAFEATELIERLAKFLSNTFSLAPDGPDWAKLPREL